MLLLLQVSCYNTALSYKGDAASGAQRPHSPTAAATAAVSSLHSMRRPPEFAHYAEYGGMEERTEYHLQPLDCCCTNAAKGL